MTTTTLRMIAAAGAVLSCSLAGCAGQSASSPATGSASSEPYIAIVSMGFQHEFWQAVKRGAEQEAAKQGARITFEGPPTETDLETQINQLQNALSRKPAVIAFAALDSKASVPILERVKEANIPVIAFDSGVESDIPLTTAATNNRAAAAEAAAHMCKLVGGTGEVGVVSHDQVSTSGVDRRDGFIEAIAATCPQVTVLQPQYGAGDQARSADITKAMIRANPKLKGIYSTNEGAAIGTVKGVEESGKTGVVLVGFDSGKAQIDAIRSGLMAGAITQNPVGMGEEIVKAAMKAIKGEQLPKVIDTGFYWYDKSNVDEPKIKAVLYH